MHAGKMEEWNNRLLQMTTALYRVTNLLPADEPIRMALRKYANAALAECVAETHDPARESAGLASKIETLLGFLAVAQALPEVKAENFLVLEREYRAFLAAWARTAKARIGRAAQHKEGAPRAARPDRVSEMREEHAPRRGDIAPRTTITNTNERQREILERLAKTTQAKVSDFYAIFQGVSPKTIQRDLQELVARNAVKKEGERRWTLYSLMGSP